MTDRLVEILYLVSAGLLSPTLILLLAFIVSTLLMLGGLVREALDRWRVRSGWLRFLSAFTTTVFGILVGGFAYGAGLVRRNWYEQDLSDLEFIASHWDSISPNHNLTSDRADTVCGVGTSDLQFNRRSDVAVRHAATKDNPSANSDGHHA